MCKVDTLRPCYRCGKPHHEPAHCPFKGTRCHNCGKLGHLRRVCRGKAKVEGKKSPKGGRRVRTVTKGEDSKEGPSVLSPIVTSSAKPIMIEVELDGHPLNMELDTGVAVSLVAEKTHREMFPGIPLEESTTPLRTYSGEPIKVVGQREVKV